MNSVLDTGAKMWGGAQLAAHHRNVPAHRAKPVVPPTPPSTLSMFIGTSRPSKASHLYEPETVVTEYRDSQQEVRTDNLAQQQPESQQNLETIINRESLRNLVSTAVDKGSPLAASFGEPLTSVEQLRDTFGKRQSWWGDLDASETRQLYHLLLPTHLKERDEIPLYDRAVMAAEARHAARIYARERGGIPVQLSSAIFDGIRHFQKTGKWSSDGMSIEEVFEKYANQLGVDADASSLEDYQNYEEVCRTVLEKSCTTNACVNALASAGLETIVRQSISKNTRRSRAQLRLLQQISKSSMRQKSSQDVRAIRALFLQLRRKSVSLTPNFV